ncbi:DNA-binding transcriptional regulator YbjK [Nocardia transvalensis]|uniref:DNA-binding transcriptional regulator YbjK n=1 Tax=Nocardia transvalensis TaxID=37333 RepID=A0A7W9PII9_9NOCA|nr:DNA-binding transcriptional regulator YbjK [Nocardia transvalensis]
MSLSSTTYHFASRDDIVAAALRWLAEQERAKAHAAVEALPARVRQSGLTHDDLLNLITEELVPEDRTALRAQYELQLYAADHPHLQAEVQTWIDAIEAMFGEVLERLEVPRPAETARLLVAVIDGLRLTALTTPATEAGAVRNRAALSWLLENLLPRPPHDSA